jgi:hypothetical protein
MIANIMVSLYHDPNMIINEGLLRHSILNSIMRLKQRFQDEFGKVVIACDSPAKSWRRHVFPQYKAKRRKDKEDSDIDWVEVYSYINMIREEIKQFLPFPVIEVEGAEADDIIATVVKEFPFERHIICSRDKDLKQLQKYPGVHQFDPVSDKYLEVEDAEKFLFEHIAKGDVSDGIPNILSDADTFIVEGKRQKPVTQKKLDLWRSDPSQLPMTFIRNKVLIDLDCIPQELVDEIKKEYSVQALKNPNLMKYFMTHDLANMLANLQNFY